MYLNRIITSGSAGSSDPRPAAANPTPPSRRGSTGLGGLLASLRIRRSAPPTRPAPPTTFQSLDQDALSVVWRKLSEGPPEAARRNVLFLAMTNKAFLKSAAVDETAKIRLLEAALVQKTCKLVDRLRDYFRIADADRVGLLASVLRVVNPQVQSRLITGWGRPDDWREPRPHEDDDIRRRELYKAFQEFVPHLAHLDETRRSELVHKATDCIDPALAAMAIGGLSRGLAHLTAPMIEQLMGRAFGLQNKKWRAQAIRDLSDGLAHMNPGQRQRMVQAAVSIHDPQLLGWVLEGLCAELEHLPAERGELFERAMALSAPAHLARALTGLAGALGVLDDAHQETVLTKALSLPAPHPRHEVVCALAAKAEHLGPQQRRRLVDAILQTRSHHEIAALGASLGHVSTDQQDLLLEVVANLEHTQKAVALEGLAAGLPSLGPSHRDKLAASVLALDKLHWKTAAVIGAMGPHLKHLGDSRRDALFDQALLALGDIAETHALEDMKALTAGLATGLAALREDQRQTLVTEAVTLASRVPRRSRRNLCNHTCNSLMLRANAIAGLASGRQHLKAQQFELLIEAAHQLQADCNAAWLPRRQDREDGDLTLPDEASFVIPAVAFFALAAA